MWAVIVLVAVVSGVTARVSYDGTPLDDSSRVFFQRVPFVDSSSTVHLPPPVITVPAPQPTFPAPRIIPVQPQNLHSLGSCGLFSHPLVDECHGSQAYHFSWRNNPGREFTWHEAQNYCEHLGFTALSIEHESEDIFITSVIISYNIRAIWTSGRKVSYEHWAWVSHSSSGYTNWSHTGRLGRPQPDNAEGDENCLSVGYNLYNDGVRWHDVRCSYRKFVICEAARHDFLH